MEKRRHLHHPRLGSETTASSIISGAWRKSIMEWPNIRVLLRSGGASTPPPSLSSRTNGEKQVIGFNANELVVVQLLRQRAVVPWERRTVLFPCSKPQGCGREYKRNREGSSEDQKGLLADRGALSSFTNCVLCPCCHGHQTVLRLCRVSANAAGGKAELG
mmetsp:Transcript_49125/g.73263  ORF Transcript_49125/g.73263 Transcript_49125/m.73263 type:complete len:161 (-) Transcript_49125:541-1023(-)